MDALGLGLVHGNGIPPGSGPAGPDAAVPPVSRPDMVDNIFSRLRAGTDAAGLADLVDRCRRGEARAQESVYLIFKRPVFNIAYRYTGNRSEAEDLAQDVFIKVFTHIADVKDAGTFPAWVFRIAVNACFSRLRKQRAAGGPPVALDEVEDAVAFEDPGPQEADHDLRGALERALAGLPPKLRQVFILHDVQGFKHEEISGIMRCSVGTSKSQLFKARMRVRNALRRDGAVKEKRS